MLKAEPSADGRNFYKPELDILRFGAFFAVFVFHALRLTPDALTKHHVPYALAEALCGLIRAGAYGVDLFFALSAYVITALLLREKAARGRLDIGAFYMRRILRIWPLYFFS